MPEFIDTLKMCFDNNLIIGNTPEAVTPEMLASKMHKDKRTNEDIQAFGLFDSNTANYNTYYPGVTAADLVPKEDEFIHPTFRALSEVIVHKEYNPVDFGMNGILKKSMGLLLGSTVNVDHETSIGNAIGSVQGVSWEESYTTENGLIIPAGINSKLKIDGKSNPKLARGVMMSPPSIHSTSVTVQFGWEKSHAHLEEKDFFTKIGSFDKDGQLIRRVATKIKRYHEISLVSHGADPYAQLIKDTGIVNPKFADVSYNSLTGDQKRKQVHYFFDYKTDVLENSIPKQSNNNSPITNKSIMKRETLILMAAIMGITLPKPEDDNAELSETEIALFQNKVTELVNANTSNTTLLAENTTEIERLRAVETQFTTDSATFAEAIALKAFQDNATTSLRTKVLATYKKVEGDKALPAITKLIETGSFETLTALETQYTIQLDEKYPLSCKSCKSTDISRASAELNTPAPGEDGNGKTSLAQDLRKKAKSHTKTIGMHEKQETSTK